MWDVERRAKRSRSLRERNKLIDMRKGDLVGVIESVYAETETDDVWLARLLDAAAPITDRGLGAAAVIYDTNAHPLRVSGVRVTPNAVLPAHALVQMLEGATPEYIDNSWKRLHCALASEVRGWEAEPARRKYLESVGVKDLMSLNAYDSSGVGVCIGAFLPRAQKLERKTRSTYERIATHLASGFRLRRRVRAAEAILSTSGAVLDASTDESQPKPARAALREAVRQIERARGPLRHREPERAVLSWRALVRSRWSLVDHFESDGKRLIVAIANEPAPPPISCLTARERNVLELVVQGHTTKLVAYELGLSDSTVRVLLMRATRKLGVRSRDDAIERYRKLTRVYEKP